MLRICSLVAFAVCTTTSVAAGGSDAPERTPRLAIRVSPWVFSAPAYVVVRATIEHDARNRAIQISAESADFYRSSEMSLEGEKAPRVSQFEFPNLPSGVYEVRAVLKDSRNRALAFARTEVHVMQGGTGK